MLGRRSLLGGVGRAVADGALAAVPVAFGGVGTAGATIARPQAKTRRGRTADRSGMPVVLVHGGWHAGWCWRRVVPLLRAAGLDPWTPTLSGLADRAHLLSPEVGLATHVRDIVGVLEFEDLRDVLLVGHSYGGMVIAGVAERAADRLAGLVFLDAFVPGDGDSLIDLLPPERRAVLLALARDRGDDWRVPPPGATVLGVTDIDEARRVEARLTDHPLRASQEPIHLGNPAAAALPRTYVHCTEGPLVPGFAPFATRVREDPDWTVRDLATGHDAMVLAPQALSAILIEAMSEATSTVD